MDRRVSLKFGDGRLVRRRLGLRWISSISLFSFTLAMIFGNWFWPSRRRQVFCAPSTSLNTMASAVLFNRQPFERIVR